MLDGIKVDYYGTSTPLTGCAALGGARAKAHHHQAVGQRGHQGDREGHREANLGLNR